MKNLTTTVLTGGAIGGLAVPTFTAILAGALVALTIDILATKSE